MRAGSPNAEIRVRRIASRRDRLAALSLAREPYRDVEAWVPPDLRAHDRVLRARTKSRTVHPLIAENGGEPLATIVLTIHEDAPGQDGVTATLGFFEAMPHQDEAVDRLFLEAFEIARDAGATRVSGPWNGHRILGLGCRDDRFQETPVFGVPYGRPEYVSHWWRQGFRAARSHYSFRIDLAASATRAAVRAVLASDPPANVSIRPAVTKEWPRETLHFAEVAPMEEVPAPWIHFAPPRPPRARELSLVAEESGRPVGFLFAVPDWNLALRGSEHAPESLRGRLRIRFRERHIDRAALLEIAVSPRERRRGIATALAAQALHRLDEFGYREAECALVPDEDAATQRIARRFGGAHTTTHRLFERELP